MLYLENKRGRNFEDDSERKKNEQQKIEQFGKRCKQILQSGS